MGWRRKASFNLALEGLLEEVTAAEVLVITRSSFNNDKRKQVLLKTHGKVHSPKLELNRRWW